MARRTYKKGEIPPPGSGKGGKGGKGSGSGSDSSGSETVGSTPLLPGETEVGSYDGLIKKGKRGDNLTPHHIPSDTFMTDKGVPGYSRGKGICIMMEQPPTGGRHRQTGSYGRSPDLDRSPREALLQEVEDCRQVYKDAGLYDADLEARLQEIIRQNQEAFPGVFDEEDGGEGGTDGDTDGDKDE